MKSWNILEDLTPEILQIFRNNVVDYILKLTGKQHNDVLEQLTKELLDNSMAKSS